MHTSVLVVLIWLTSTARIVSARAGEPSAADGLELLSFPLFRPPSAQEQSSSPYPILWSAHEAGDSRRRLPNDGPIRLACLVDGIGPNSSVPIQSLVWQLVDEASGQETRHLLQGSGRDFNFEATGLHFSGSYSEWVGSTLDVTFSGLLRGQLRVRCEYKADGFSEMFISPRLLLWDERVEVRRLQAASLTCSRTVYRPSGGASNPPLAVSYSCQGIGDTCLLEAAVVSVYVVGGGTAGNCSSLAAARAGFYGLSSNSTASGRHFFGVAFDERLLFGWTVGGGVNSTSMPGAALERRLALPEARLCLALSATLPSGRALLLNFAVPKSAASTSAAVSPELPLLVPIGGKHGKIQVQLDELRDPQPERLLPCPMLCLKGATEACLHRWVGPDGVAPPRSGPASQPLSLALRISDQRSLTGAWTCGTRPAGTSAISYMVTTLKRPMVCGPRLPRRTVLFPPDRLSANCSLCNLSGNATADFDAFVTKGTASYKTQREDVHLEDGSVRLTLKIFEFSAQNSDTTIVLRCQAVEPGGKRSGQDYAAVHVLPLPFVRPLGVCPAEGGPCKADCRSPAASRLRALGVSVTYLFSIYNSARQLQRALMDSSGVLEDARKAVGGQVQGALSLSCRQLFYHNDQRDGLSAQVSLGAEPEQSEVLRLELGDQRYKQLILALSDQPVGNGSSTTKPPSTSGGMTVLYIFLGCMVAAVLLLCAGAATGVVPNTAPNQTPRSHMKGLSFLKSANNSDKAGAKTARPEQRSTALGAKIEAQSLRTGSQETDLGAAGYGTARPVDPAAKSALNSQGNAKQAATFPGTRQSEAPSEGPPPGVMDSSQSADQSSSNFNAVQHGLEANFDKTLSTKSAVISDNDNVVTSERPSKPRQSDADSSGETDRDPPVSNRHSSARDNAKPTAPASIAPCRSPQPSSSIASPSNTRVGFDFCLQEESEEPSVTNGCPR